MPFPCRRSMSVLGGLITLSASLFLAAPPGSTAAQGKVAPHPVKTDRELVPLTALEKSKAPEARFKRTVTSREVDLPATTTVIGASWAAGSVGSGDVVQVRSKSSGSWTPWQEMPRESVNLADSEHGGEVAPVTATDPFVVVGEQAQVRVLSADAVVPKVTAVIVDPGVSDADSSVSREATASSNEFQTIDGAPRPAISSRAAWGADESIRKGEPNYGQAHMAFIHHTAGANGYSSSSVPSIIRGIYAYHVKTLGWNDIGYNILVDRFGRAWEGRAGGLEKAVVGAHTYGHNGVSFGVSAIGDYSTLAPSSQLLGALEAVVAWKMSVHGVPATGTVVVDGTTYNRISGHRDAKGNSTECPGQALYDRLPQIRQDVAARMGQLRQVDGARSWSADSRPDLVRPSGQGSVSASLGQSLAPLRLGQRAGSGWQVLDNIILSQDVTGDRRADIIARDLKTTGLRVYRGNGKGGADGVVQGGSGWQVMNALIAGGDRTGDGSADLLAIRSDGVLILYAGDGAGWFRAGRIIGSGFGAYRSLVSVGDVDGDGRGELMGLRNSDQKLIRWTTTADGALGPATVQSSGWGAISTLVGTGDLDGDGADADLLARETSGRMRSYYAHDRKPLSRASIWGAGWNELDNVTGGADWNGDGHTDVLARNRQSGDLVAYDGTGVRDFNRPSEQLTLGLDADLVRLIGDVDGDGRGDAIARDAAGDLYRLDGTSSGFGQPVRLDSGWQRFSAIEPAGDYTRDGVPDVLGLTPDGKLYLYSLDRSWQWTWSTQISSSMSGMLSVTGTGSINADFNGDILGLRKSDGALVLRPATGPGALNESVVLMTGQNDLVHIEGAGDMNGDGKNDVLARDRSGGWWLYVGTGTGLSPARQPVSVHQP